jgi:L-cysteine desulfidase
MEMDKTVIKQILNILEEEIVPAEGCTEPIAIAYTAAKTVEILGTSPERLDIYVSGNIIKNVKSVIVPNSEGMVGIEASAALGALAGDSSRELLVISSIERSKLQDIREFIKNGRINVFHEDNGVKLYVRVEAFSGDESASVEIKHIHTNITEIKRNGSTIISRPCNDSDFNSSLSDRKILSVELIYNLAKSIDYLLIKPIFEKVISLNSTIAIEGLKGTYGVNVGAMIQENINNGNYGDDKRNRAASFAAAGSDARMSGCPLPVMTTSGSGNQGMTASLPIIRYCLDKGISRENMIRSLFLSHLLTIHIKTNVGRLSAYCGAVCAVSGVSGALAFLEKGDLKIVGDAVTNTLANISGLICDGAKASCASKIATGVYTAFDSAMLALNNRVFNSEDGIVSQNIEKTILNIGRLSQEGMVGTDNTILNIMTGK